VKTSYTYVCLLVQLNAQYQTHVSKNETTNSPKYDGKGLLISWNTRKMHGI